MVELAGEFESSLCASWEAKRLDNLPLFARPAVELATRTYEDYINSMQDHIGKWNTRKLKTRLECSMIATEVLRDLLQIQGGRCGLIDDPQREIKFALPKGYKEPTEFSGISLLRTFYQGFKLTLATTVNATDGSVIPMGPQPIKAITQTALQFINHVEVWTEAGEKLRELTRAQGFIGLQDQIGKLQKHIQDMLDVVHRNHQAPFAVGKLKEYVEKFLYRLQRTVIRLHLILAMCKIKRFVALAAVKDMINEESEEFRHTMVELEAVGQKMESLDSGVQALSSTVQGVSEGISLLSSRHDESEFLKWLGNEHDVSKRPRELQNVAHESPAWLFKEPNFIDWETQGGIYWIGATSGTGKSVIMFETIKHLVEIKKRHVVFFYFDKTDKAHPPTLRDFLAALVCQLKTPSMAYDDNLMHAYGERGTEKNASEEALRAAATSMVRTSVHVVIAIDALDECPATRSDFWEQDFFPLIQQLRDSGAHLIVSSRREHRDLSPFLSSRAAHCLNLNSSDQHHTSVHHFIQTQLSKRDFACWQPEDARRDLGFQVVSWVDGV
ncbi:hypothetical protein AURDEDRAFT_122301 [Auricularia subglabra TFB-10046 SS5]|nr:hypothetical protein AURDEDRAFT_122301 [Auricularia subglabra TFB-10046 SS5]